MLVQSEAKDIKRINENVGKLFGKLQGYLCNHCEGIRASGWLDILLKSESGNVGAWLRDNQAKEG